MIIDVKEKYKDYLNTPEGADIYNRFKEVLYGTPDSLVVRLADKLLSHVVKKDINILDVGGGDGKRLILLKDMLNSKGIECSATLVDQSKVFIEHLKGSLKNNNRAITPVCSTFEDYIPTETFDVVLMIHSIFTFRDDFYVEKLKELLSTSGLVIIVADSQDSFLAGLKSITDGSLGTERKDIVSVVSDLSSKGFTIEQETSETCYDDCIADGKLDEKGKLILRWIAMRDWKDIPPAMVDMATDLFIERSKGGKICDTECFVYANL